MHYGLRLGFSAESGLGLQTERFRRNRKSTTEKIM